MQEITTRHGRAGAAMAALLPLFLALAVAVPGDARADGGYVSP